PGQLRQPNHCVLVHADQPTGLTHAAAVCQVLEDGDGFVLRQTRVEQRRSFALGKPGLASAAAQQATLLGTVTPRDRQIAVPTLAVVMANRILTAEATQVVHGGPPWPVLNNNQGLFRTPHQTTNCLAFLQC